MPIDLRVVRPAAMVPGKRVFGNSFDRLLVFGCFEQELGPKRLWGILWGEHFKKVGNIE
jgi:hypothetical protein